MSRPPILAILILRLVVESGDRRFLLSDLAEEYESIERDLGKDAARRWYWEQVLRSIVPSLKRRLLKKRQLPLSRVFSRLLSESVWQDFRFAIRAMFKAPGFASIAILTLALGIGTTSATFSVVNSVLLNPIPVDNADRLVELFIEGTEFGAQITTSPPPQALDAWIDESNSFEEIGLFDERQFLLSDDGEPNTIEAAAISANLLDILQTYPILGRMFSSAEVSAGDTLNVLLSEGYWRNRFGADVGVVGGTLNLDGAVYTIIGVIPDRTVNLIAARLFFGSSKALWVPLSRQSLLEGSNPFVIARLHKNVTAETAQVELDLIQDRIASEGVFQSGWHPIVVPAGEETNKNVVRVLWILLASVGMVLLIGCVNIANLLLARGLDRSHEFAMRSALGASSSRISRQLLIEGLLLSVLGATIGLLLAHWIVDSSVAIAATHLKELRSVRIDQPVFVFTVVLALFTTIIFAFAPALQLRSKDIAGLLSQNKRSGVNQPQSTLIRNGLVAIEVALALTLFLGAGLLVRSFVRLSNVDPGFDAERIVALELALPESRYPDAVQRRGFFEALAERMEAIPGTESASLASRLPPRIGWILRSIEIVGNTEYEDESPAIPSNWVSPNYFRTIGASVVEGRPFSYTKIQSESTPVIVNETFASRAFPDGGAVGSVIRMTSPTGDQDAAEEHAIVGVVQDIKVLGLADVERTNLYFPFGQYGSSDGVVVLRTQLNPSDLIPMAKELVWSLDPDLPIDRVLLPSDDLANNIALPRYNSVLMSVFAGLALFLAAVGVYGVIWLSAQQRTSEIGIRIALGARNEDITKLMVGDGLKTILVGVTVGIVMSLVLSRFLSHLLFGIANTDPITYIVATIVLCACGTFACYLPARNATKLDPVEVLRKE
ncbi:MAG: ABC transporter permease [Myxococcota bacterium]|nr:ABC transporter permease [Myxococcota bacterium]